MKAYRRLASLERMAGCSGLAETHKRIVTLRQKLGWYLQGERIEKRIVLDAADAVTDSCLMESRGIADRLDESELRVRLAEKVVFPNEDGQTTQRGKSGESVPVKGAKVLEPRQVALAVRISPENEVQTHMYRKSEGWKLNHVIRDIVLFCASAVPVAAWSKHDAKRFVEAVGIGLFSVAAIRLWNWATQDEQAGTLRKEDYLRRLESLSDKVLDAADEVRAALSGNKGH